MRRIKGKVLMRFPLAYLLFHSPTKNKVAEVTSNISLQTHECQENSQGCKC